MDTINITDDHERYARCIQSSKKVRWDINEDVIRGRLFDSATKFLPDSLSLADDFTTLSANEKRFVSQIQGRTYANIFGLVERFINAKVLELSNVHWLGDQIALEALVRFSDEELKHQALFRLIDAMIGDVLPQGYRFDVMPIASPAPCSARAPGPCWRSRWISSSSPRSTIAKASGQTLHSQNFSRTCSSSTGRRKVSTQSSTSSN